MDDTTLLYSNDKQPRFQSENHVVSSFGVPPYWFRTKCQLEHVEHVEHALCPLSVLVAHAQVCRMRPEIDVCLQFDRDHPYCWHTPARDNGAGKRVFWGARNSANICWSLQNRSGLTAQKGLSGAFKLLPKVKAPGWNAIKLIEEGSLSLLVQEHIDTSCSAVTTAPSRVSASPLIHYTMPIHLKENTVVKNISNTRHVSFHLNGVPQTIEAGDNKIYHNGSIKSFDVLDPPNPNTTYTIVENPNVQKDPEIQISADKDPAVLTLDGVEIPLKKEGE
ncbi:hypothetical protein AG1IA_08813 [Rhizoctonia solani AG-1 IA]|uniref:Uncharacterized protein n=1 Tax=Thanatephorus cucumeris (strain AG1-IA) TaxID=983506 RepID=L8WK83_THACA|nr:hypothetical protein AG1IA_08813 [Rhizoctonia solani AG-1 IA]